MTVVQPLICRSAEAFSLFTHQVQDWDCCCATASPPASKLAPMPTARTTLPHLRARLRIAIPLRFDRWLFGIIARESAETMRPGATTCRQHACGLDAGSRDG